MEWERETQRYHGRDTGTVQQESLGHRLLTALDVLVSQSGEKKNKSQPLQAMGEAEQRGEAALVLVCNPFIQSVSQSDLESCSPKANHPPDVTTTTTLC